MREEGKEEGREEVREGTYGRGLLDDGPCYEHYT